VPNRHSESSVDSPGFIQALFAAVASQLKIMTDTDHKLPGLSTIEGFRLAIYLDVIEKRVFRIFKNIGIVIKYYLRVSWIL
jgi:hypothetical protein